MNFPTDAKVAAEIALQLKKFAKGTTHTARFETDTMEMCKPKVIRKRELVILREKVVVAHLCGSEELKITEI